MPPVYVVMIMVCPEGCFKLFGPSADSPALGEFSWSVVVFNVRPGDFAGRGRGQVAVCVCVREREG